MSHAATIDAPEKSDDVVSLQKQIADLLRKNQSLEQENEKLNKRFGLVWPEQPEFFVQVISDTEVVYQNGLYRRVGALETNGSKARLDFDGSDESEDLKRGDSPYLYTGKQSNKTYLGNGGIAYEWRKFINEDYLPTLVKKGSGFGFDDKNGKRDNLLIEGDNYHALQVLQHTHRGAIDVIYIDPPYNTGNGDFKYNDRFVSDEDGNKHSAWLSFMEKRLVLAKSLLSSRGCIFISIDKNEQPHLGLLMNKIFGESKQVGCLIKKTSGGKSDSKYFAERHEYLYLYRVSDDFTLNEIKENKTGKSQLMSKWGDTSDLMDRPNMGYPIYVEKSTGNILVSDINPVCAVKNDLYATKENIRVMREREDAYWEKLGRDEYYQIYPKYSEKGSKAVLDGRWRWQKSSLAGKTDSLLFKVNKNYGPYIYEVVDSGERSIKRSSVIDSFGQGGADLSAVIPGNSFSYPKPLEYLKYILNASFRDAVILDFFAGSGTTGHAAWQLNKEDGGSRTFVLVTNNESNICEDVTYERLRRCNLPEHGNYQQGLEYLQLKHVAETEVDGYDMATSFEHIKQVVNVRFGSFNVIEETDDWYITDKIAVLKNYVKYPAFFEKYGEHPAYGLVTKKERQAQTFRTEAAKRVSIDDIHVFNKEYLNDLYRVVREDMA